MDKKTITLPIFGETELKITAGEYRYEAHLWEYTHGGRKIDIGVHFKTADGADIEKAGQVLDEIDKISALGSDAIAADYHGGGEAEYYIRDWSEDIFSQIFTKEEFLEYLAPTDAAAPLGERLLSLLRLVSLGIYAGSGGSFIVLDYAFGYDMDRGFRDDMLVVKMNEEYEVTEIVTEG
jgi:hypothetical protein